MSHYLIVLCTEDITCVFLPTMWNTTMGICNNTKGANLTKPWILYLCLHPDNGGAHLHYDRTSTNIYVVPFETQMQA